jgi:hypothetical protein
MELERAFFDEMVEHGLAAFPNEAVGCSQARRAGRSSSSP